MAIVTHYTPRTPPRTNLQRLDALARANDTRQRRAQLKRELKAGHARLADLLESPPEWLHTAKVGTLLLCLPRVGPVKANRALRQAVISPSKTIGGMTARQRSALVRQLAR